VLPKANKQRRLHIAQDYSFDARYAKRYAYRVSVPVSIETQNRKRLAHLSETEHKVLSWLLCIHKQLPHPVVAIVLGFAIAVENLPLRSAGIWLIAAWLLVDFWVWWIKKRCSRPKKYTTGGLVTGVLVLCAWGTVYFLKTQKLADERQDALKHIESAMYLEDNNALDSVVTITNNSDQQIGDYVIRCMANGIKGKNFNSVQGLVLSASDKKGRSIAPGGDATSETCLSPVREVLGDGGEYCADITVTLSYVLRDQPKIPQERRWRYVYFDKVNSWHRESYLSSEKFCNVLGGG
jgi:hypothetical protein